MQVDLNEQYNLRVTGAQLILIESVLQSMPYKDSAGILNGMPDKVTPILKVDVKKEKSGQ